MRMRKSWGGQYQARINEIQIEAADEELLYDYTIAVKSNPRRVVSCLEGERYSRNGKRGRVRGQSYRYNLRWWPVGRLFFLRHDMT
jgi:hypothetical protein